MDENLQESNVRVLFFAKARELAGTGESRINIPKRISSVDLIRKIVNQFGLESIKDTLILALNEAYVCADVQLELCEKDEIAIIPPLSGGINYYDLFYYHDISLNVFSQVNMEEPKNIVKLGHGKLQFDDIINEVISPSCGAISTFIGTTRDSFQDKPVLKLEYEAYESMALKEMKNICDKLRAKWNVKHIAIHHRLGEVPVCESSVIIAVSSAHRQESLEAVQYAIDTLKATVTIWKKEIYSTKESQWKENKECDTRPLLKEKSLDNVQESKDIKSSLLQANVGKIEIDQSQVQVRADSEEIKRRIQCYMTRKRQQVNSVNVHEFCSNSNDENESSCARVDAILIRRKDSKSHVKVHRVINRHGPQTTNLTAFLDSSRQHLNPQPMKCQYSSVEDRLTGPEEFLGVNKPVPRDIYERIKNIEDRIQYLESISPEYKDFYAPGSAGNFNNSARSPSKRTFSTAEVDSKLLELEAKYVKKMK